MVMLTVFHPEPLRLPWATPQLPQKQRTLLAGFSAVAVPIGVFMVPDSTQTRLASYP